MTNLPPAAQAVMQAALNAQDEWDLSDSIAAALRAAACQLREAYANEACVESADDWLDSIAAELENAQ